MPADRVEMETVEEEASLPGRSEVGSNRFSCCDAEGTMQNTKTQEPGGSQILFPVAVGAVFLVVLVVGAMIG